VKRVVAAVHAGWRGTVAGIVPLTLARMAKQYGSNPRTTRVGIGPSIGPCCYEVDKPVLDRVCASGVEYRNVVQDKGGGKAMLDLGALVRFQARAAGVPAEHIDRVELCTVCHPDLFYSYRREGAVVGTMVSGIMLVPQGRTAGH
jgi:YfiH family protein